jgi:GNAT superfamily N-acetyltransferase
MTGSQGPQVRRAEPADLDALVPLFEGYRQFYKADAERDGARAFLAERLEQRDSAIFLATVDGAAVGFTQLYPSFTSVRMARIFILNDLFVVPEARMHGAGKALLLAAQEYAAENGAIRLTLETATDNVTAQALYEADGWVRDSAFYTYTLMV